MRFSRHRQLLVIFCAAVSLFTFRSIDAHGAAPSKMVIAHASMNARTVMLWTAEEQKFFSEYGTDIDLGKRRGIAALCIGGDEAVALMVERVD